MHLVRRELAILIAHLIEQSVDAPPRIALKRADGVAGGELEKLVIGDRREA